MRPLLAAALASACLLCAAPASAQEVTVAPFSGANNRQLRQVVVGVLNRQRGVRLVGRGDVTVRGEIRQRGNAWTATITVEADGETRGEAEWRGRTPAAIGQRVRRQLWSELGEAITSAGSTRGRATPRPQPEEDGPDDGPPTRRERGRDARVVVLQFGGPDADGARSAVVAALEAEDVEVLNVGATPERLDDFIDIATEMEARAFVEGEVYREGRSLFCEVFVRNGEDGEIVAEHRFRGRSASSLSRAIERGLWSRLAPAIEGARAPGGGRGGEAAWGAGDDEDVDEDIDEDADWRTDEDGPSERPSPLTVGAGLHASARQYHYEDDIFNQLRGYQLQLFPALAITATAYPAAFVTDGLAAHLGVTVDLAYGFALSSSDRSGVSFPTQSIRFAIGARGRVPVGDHEIGLFVGYQRHTYTLSAAQGVDPNLPGVEYGAIRAGADAWIAVAESFGLHARFAWLQLLSVGELGEAEWFPRLTGNGIHFAVGAGLRFGAFEVRGLFEAYRYFFTLRPEPGDPWVAGGALDQYPGGSLTLLYHLPGD